MNRRYETHSLDFALFAPINENFMRRDLKIYSCGLLLIFFIFASGSVYSQDLGSSNKLFDPSTPKTTTVKKTAPKSSAAYCTAIQLSTDVPTMILVADVMQSQQKYLESEQLLRQALRDDPKNPTALYSLGRALTIRGSYDEAESVLKKSANVSPNSFVYYVLLSSLYLRREDYNDAGKYLLKALSMFAEQKKRLSQDFEAIGDGYLKAGKSKDAVRAYRQAINLDTGKAVLADKLAKAQGS